MREMVLQFRPRKWLLEATRPSEPVEPSKHQTGLYSLILLGVFWEDLLRSPHPKDPKVTQFGEGCVTQTPHSGV